MNVKVDWDIAPLERAKRRWQGDGLRAASRHYRDALRTRLSIQGRPVSRRSRPGEAPRRETGELIRSWQITVNAPAGYAIVYSNLEDAAVLEYGGPGTWGWVAPRPSIRRTLLAEEATLADLLTQPLP